MDLRASFTAFAVAVAEKGTVGGGVESAGSSWARRAVLCEKREEDDSPCR